MTTLPQVAKDWANAKTFVTLGTINEDGSPQLSVLWVTVEDDEIVLSTIKGRRKYANMLRDSRVSVLIPDPADAYRYIEVRGTVTMVDEGGDDLITALSDKYRGITPYPGIARGEERVVVRVHAERVVEYL